MMLDPLLRALRRHRGISEFIVREIDERHDFVGHGVRKIRGQEVRRSVSARIFVDTRQGRGESHLRVVEDAALDPQLDAAVGRAALNIGPAWRLPAPTAPAQVEVADSALTDEPARALDAATRSIGGNLDATVWIASAEVRCVTSAGFDNRYSDARIGTRVERSHVGPITDSARRIADLGPRVTERDEPGQRPHPGEYALVLAGSAHGDDPHHSIFAPFLALADADAYRMGRSRVREGGRLEIGEELSLWSDGTIDFGIRSRPFDDDGCGSRRFSLVESGTLAGLAVDVRSAGLLGREPNGGICNLVVTTAMASTAELLEPRQRPVLVIDEASWVRAEPSSDTLSIGIRRGRVVDAANGERPVSGGIAHGTMATLLARPLGSRARTTRGWYRGPSLLHLGDCRVID